MKTALILSGGGARAAYQVGVLKALGELLPKTSTNPFQIVCGTSAGAINAAKIASEADQFHYAVTGLEEIWLSLNSEHILRVGYLDILKSIMKIFLSFFHSGIAQGQPLSVFDNRPLFSLLKRSIDMTRLNKMINEQYLHALSISTLGYTSGQNIAFFQGQDSIQAWASDRRLGVRTELGHKHLMASSAIPTIFPSVRINREYFGDGAVRQSAPLSAALHLGADKLLVVGVSENKTGVDRIKTDHSPSIAQVLGHMLNSAFLDALDEDVAMLRRFNGFANHLSTEQQTAMKVRPVEVLVIKPSVKFDVLAMQFVHHLPSSMRLLLSIIGANRKGGGGSLASYMLFERDYCSALIDSGYQDAMKQAEEIRQFVGVCEI